MKKFDIKKLVTVSALGLVTIIGTSEIANAQGSGRNNDDRRYNQDQRISRQQQKIEQQRIEAERKRVLAEQKRQAELDRRRNRNNGNWNNGNNGNNGNWNNSNNGNNRRYRVVRNGRNYNTDYRGAELLRQAVNAGYQQGYQAGQTDRSGRRRSNWTSNGVYSSGTYGYQSYVDRSQYQYYFQQGFQKGYQDGYNTRNQYGTNNGGNILSSILGQILNIQSY